MTEAQESAALEMILSKCRDAGGKFAASLSGLATELGLEKDELQRALRKWRQANLVQTKPNGRLGLLIAVPGSFAAVTRGNAARRRNGKANEKAREKTAGKASAYCVACGSPVDTEWRYCWHCGSRLPTEDGVR